MALLDRSAEERQETGKTARHSAEGHRSDSNPGPLSWGSLHGAHALLTKLVGHAGTGRIQEDHRWAAGLNLEPACSLRTVCCSEQLCRGQMQLQGCFRTNSSQSADFSKGTVWHSFWVRFPMAFSHEFRLWSFLETPGTFRKCWPGHGPCRELITSNPLASA